MTLVAKSMGAQVAFSLILLVREKGLRWTEQILLVNDRLGSWCQQKRYLASVTVGPSLRFKDCWERWDPPDQAEKNIFANRWSTW